MGHHLSNKLLLAALFLNLLALLLGSLLFRLLLLLQLLLFLLLQLLSLEFLLATLFLCCARKMRSIRKRFLPAHPIIRFTSSAAPLLCQRSLLRERRILILVTANVPLVVIVYFFVISPYGGRITVDL